MQIGKTAANADGLSKGLNLGVLLPRYTVTAVPPSLLDTGLQDFERRLSLPQPNSKVL